MTTAMDFSVKFHVLLHGIEVPLVSFVLDEFHNAPAQAIVEIPPTVSASLIRPRTPIHIMFSGAEPLVENARRRYLLFEGEVLGVGMKRTIASKNIKLTCFSIPSYLDTTYIYHQGLNGAMEFASNENIMVRGGGVSPIISPISEMVVAKYITSIANNKDPVTAAKSFLANIGITNTFYVQQDLLYNFKERISDFISSEGNNQSATDRTFSQILKQNVSNKILGKAGFSVAGSETLRSFITKIMSIAFYDIYFNSSNIKSMSIRPNLFYAPPPKCNVIFPSQYTSFDYDRLYTQEPTRAILASGLAIASAGKNINKVYVSPPALRKLSEASKDKGALTGLVFDSTLLLTGSDEGGESSFGIDETSIGIVPYNIQDGQWLHTTWNAISGIDSESIDEAKDMDDYLSDVVDYHLIEYRYRLRSFTTFGPFNPNPVCGFTSLLLNETMSIYGYLVSKRLMVNAAGSASQIMTFSHARFANENPVPMKPRWLDKDLYNFESNINIMYDKWIHADRPYSESTFEIGSIGTDEQRASWSPDNGIFTSDESNVQLNIAEDILKVIENRGEVNVIYGSTDNLSSNPGYRRHIINDEELFSETGKYHANIDRSLVDKKTFSTYRVNPILGKTVGPLASDGFDREALERKDYFDGVEESIQRNNQETTPDTIQTRSDDEVYRHAASQGNTALINSQKNKRQIILKYIDELERTGDGTSVVK